jgi:hypothetical protein
MTAIYQSPAAVAQSDTSVSTDRLAVRREALTALDSFVRPMLLSRLRLPFSITEPTVDLSIYDEIYGRSATGGHWTMNTRWMGFVGHTIAGYTVSLEFDGADRPTRFVVAGAREVVTDDATPESLSRGLDAVRFAGPLLTWAPNFPPGVSL